MKKVVCAFGTFDILHLGHSSYLSYARKYGTYLTVVVTRDSVVVQRKGRGPLFNQKDRAALVLALRGVDRVVLGDRDESWHVLATVRPAIICFGYDQADAKKSLIASLMYKALGSPPIVMAPPYRRRQFHSRMLRAKKLTPNP